MTFKVPMASFQSAASLRPHSHLFYTSSPWRQNSHLALKSSPRVLLLFVVMCNNLQLQEMWTSHCPSSKITLLIFKALLMLFLTREWPCRCEDASLMSPFEKGLWAVRSTASLQVMASSGSASEAKGHLPRDQGLPLLTIHWGRVEGSISAQFRML